MRRTEKQIDDLASIEYIISRALVCRLALSENDCPYIVPLSFGYKNKVLYFHCAREGKKLDILRTNNRVCFEIDIDVDLKKANKACQCGFDYRCVIGFGTAEFIDDVESKRKALDIIMQHYWTGPFEYSAKAVKNTVIVKVEILSMTGKKSGY